MSGPAHSCTATMPAAAKASSAAMRAVGALLGGQQRPRGGADQVVGVGGQRAAAASKPAASIRPGPAAQRGRAAPNGRRRGPGRRRRSPSSASRSAVVGAARSGQPDSSQPCAQMTPSGWARAYSASRCRQCRSEVGGPQVEPDEGQAGGGQVHVAVDECRCDERAVEVDDLGVGKLGAANVIAAEPRDDAVAHGHRRGVGHGGAVHPPVEQECRHLFGLALHGVAARRR